MMRKLIKLFVVVVCISNYGYGQDLGTENKQNKMRKPIAFTNGFSKVLNAESDELDVYAGIMLERKNGWGYGFDFTKSAYTPSSLQGLPPISEIENFEGTELPEGTDINFSYTEKRDNRLYSLSLNVFKSIALNNKKSIKLYIMAGPSIIYSEDYEYKVEFSPGSSGGFGFPLSIGPSLDYRRSKESKKIILGGFSKISLRYTFNKVVGLELSGYGNVNRVKSVYGVQFGVVLGRLK